MKLRRILLTFAFLLCATWCYGSTITVDFSQPVHVNSVSGQLLGIDDSNPTDDMILPLKFGSCRQVPNKRLDSLGMVNVELIGWRCGSWEPYRNFPKYENELERWLTEHDNAKHDPAKTIWEVWNEPDIAFWHGTRAQYLETYKHAYRTIRRIKGDKALVAGPSLALFNVQFFQQFFDYCLNNNLEVNVVAWHELAYDDNISVLSRHCDYIRNEYMNNPKYKKLNIQQLNINEYSGPKTTLEPAANLAYLYYMEKSKVDYASRGFWKDPDGFDTAFSGRMGGLLDKNHKPRAIWWLYKVYADGLDSRVYSNTYDEDAVALASSESGTPYISQIILGQYGRYANDITLNLKGLDSLKSLKGKKTLTLESKRIPNSGDRAMEKLQEGHTFTYLMPSSGSLVINFKGLEPHWAYVFYIR